MLKKKPAINCLKNFCSNQGRANDDEKLNMELSHKFGQKTPFSSFHRMGKKVCQISVAFSRKKIIY